MKRWILLIFCINKTIQARCENIQRKIERLALNPALPCEEAYDRIMRLYDFKSCLINLHILYEAMRRTLTEKESELLEKIAVKNGYFKAGEGAGSLRGANRILGRCERVLAECGFDTKRFEREYSFLAGTSPQKKTAG